MTDTATDIIWRSALCETFSPTSDHIDDADIDRGVGRLAATVATLMGGTEWEYEGRVRVNRNPLDPESSIVEVAVDSLTGLRDDTVRDSLADALWTKCVRLRRAPEGQSPVVGADRVLIAVRVGDTFVDAVRVMAWYTDETAREVKWSLDSLRGRYSAGYIKVDNAYYTGREVAQAVSRNLFDGLARHYGK